MKWINTFFLSLKKGEKHVNCKYSGFTLTHTCVLKFFKKTNKSGNECKFDIHSFQNCRFKNRMKVFIFLSLVSFSFKNARAWHKYDEITVAAAGMILTILYLQQLLTILIWWNQARKYYKPLIQLLLLYRVHAG